MAKNTVCSIYFFGKISHILTKNPTRQIFVITASNHPKLSTSHGRSALQTELLENSKGLVIGGGTLWKSLATFFAQQTSLANLDAHGELRAAKGAKITVGGQGGPG